MSVDNHGHHLYPLLSKDANRDPSMSIIIKLTKVKAGAWRRTGRMLSTCILYIEEEGFELWGVSETRFFDENVIQPLFSGLPYTLSYRYSTKRFES